MTTSDLNKWTVMMVAAVSVMIYAAAAETQVPCFFIFGDSLLDNGNNNDKVFSVAKANLLPYSIDFPGGPTGRLTNGKTVADGISELLGFDDYIPSYASARGRQILRGINYASAAAGIRPETGRLLILYTYGAKKFVLVGLAPIGCTPAALSLYSLDGSTCVECMNR